jgi:peroxiredoxin (alkyl hydroperoxide reductase subunit C)
MIGSWHSIALCWDFPWIASIRISLGYARSARAIRDVFDVEVPFPVVEDPSMVVGRTYGMIEEAATNTARVRATYFIDPEGVICAITHYPLTIGRSTDEILRMVAALQATYSGARLAPADWRQNQPLLLPADETAQQEANWFCRSEA